MRNAGYLKRDSFRAILLRDVFAIVAGARFMVHETRGVPLEKMMQQSGIESPE